MRSRDWSLAAGVLLAILAPTVLSGEHQSAEDFSGSVEDVSFDKSERSERSERSEGSYSAESSDLEKSSTTFYNNPYYNLPASSGYSRRKSTRNTFGLPKSRLPGIYPGTIFHPSFSPKLHKSKYSTPANKCGEQQPKRCERSRYRTFDGSCNNLQNPTWGAADTRYGRLLRPIYSDGINEPAISKTGRDLPLSRAVSFVMFPDANVEDLVWNLATMQYGQIITHDMALQDGAPQHKPHDVQCCSETGELLPEYLHDERCFPIVIPENDPVYTKAGIQCLNFVRSLTDLDRGCGTRNRPAEQLTGVSHYLDLSIVYGSNEQVASSLRTGIGGRMRVEIRNHREWPPSVANKTATCDVDDETDVCYASGDDRVNQNPELTVLQIIWLREHNRIARILSRMNPHWTDETIYQETRRITIAEHQHISYYEWLSIIFGVLNSYKYKILYATKGYVNDYDPTIDPSVLNEHSTAAFRYFHSLIAGYLKLADEHRQTTGRTLRLSDYFNRPGIIEEGDNMDGLMRGMTSQSEEAIDQYFDKEITRYLFRSRRRLGSDLRATDIQRNRDHGLASYNDYREFCGLPRAKDWKDFSDYISPLDLKKLASLYENADDVDFTVGGSLEKHIFGTFAGPTFLCVLIEQFYRTRVGDRFWYETGDPEVAFTEDQLIEIRKASIARLFCDNGDNISSMQRLGFMKVNLINPIVSCDKIPEVDLSYWKDYAPQTKHSHPYYKKK